MKEYIERESIKSEILSWAVCINHPEYLSTDDTLYILDNMPAADVAPVRHGIWEEVDWVDPDGHGFGTVRIPKAGLRCSQCSNVFKKELLWKDNYCPNCGSLMNGKE